MAPLNLINQMKEGPLSFGPIEWRRNHPLIRPSPWHPWVELWKEIHQSKQQKV